MKDYDPGNKNRFRASKEFVAALTFTALTLVGCSASDSSTIEATPTATLEQAPLAPTEVTPCPVENKVDLEDGRADPGCVEISSTAPATETMQLICPPTDESPECKLD